MDFAGHSGWLLGYVIGLVVVLVVVALVVPILLLAARIGNQAGQFPPKLNSCDPPSKPMGKIAKITHTYQGIDFNFFPVN